jgi:hypothetical protein
MHPVAIEQTRLASVILRAVLIAIGPVQPAQARWPGASISGRVFRSLILSAMLVFLL